MTVDTAEEKMSDQIQQNSGTFLKYWCNFFLYFWFSSIHIKVESFLSSLECLTTIPNMYFNVKSDTLLTLSSKNY